MLILLGILESEWALSGAQDAPRRPQDSPKAPTWSEIEAKIEPKTFPKTSKFRTRKSVPKMIENKLNFDGKIIVFLICFLVIFQCVACRVFALVDMSRCSKNIPKTTGFGTIFENRPFCLNMRLSSKFGRR